jgi:hypothetical protein
MPYLRLTLEDMLRGGLLELGVPDEAEAVRVVSRVDVLVVARHLGANFTKSVSTVIYAQKNNKMSSINIHL